MSERVSD